MPAKKKARSVLITGGTGSVGQALVRGFTSTGYRVVFQFCHDKSMATRLKKECNAEPLQLDFEQHFVLPESNYDVVVNNAGINISDVPTDEVTLEDWTRTLQVNLTVPFLIIRQCLPSMKKQRWGRIINISSIYGLRGVEGNFPYTVSKHGLSGLTKTLAKEYAALGITCNEICPGPIDSKMMRDIAKRSAAQSGGTFHEYLKEVREEIPANRMCKPADVAALALFLASPAAGYLNGVSIPLDGGMIA